MQCDAAHELHVEMTQPKRPLGSLPHQRKCFGQQRIERCALLESRLELSGLGRKFSLGKGFAVCLQGIDFSNQRSHALQLTLVLGAQEALGDGR